MRVTLLAAQSLDGFITRHDEPGSGFTSTEDKQHFVHALSGFDCSIMGGETYRVSQKAILARLSKQRLRVVMTRSPNLYTEHAAAGALEFTRENPGEIVEALKIRGYTRCALLGGGQVHKLFLEASLVDEIWLTIEPRLFGSGTPLVAGAINTSLNLQSVDKLNEKTLLVRYTCDRMNSET